MTRKVQVVLQDDLNGAEPAHTVFFGLDGKAYEIDLTDQNAQALRDALAPWIAAARRASTAQIPSPRSKSGRSPDTVDIRRWAKENHIPVSDRGRISIDLRTRYEVAHSRLGWQRRRWPSSPDAPRRDTGRRRAGRGVQLVGTSPSRRWNLTYTRRRSGSRRQRCDPPCVGRLREGRDVSVTTACAVAGVSTTTFCDWVASGCRVFRMTIWLRRAWSPRSSGSPGVLSAYGDARLSSNQPAITRNAGV
jgi:nucleoid-associated protein Lsr2